MRIVGGKLSGRRFSGPPGTATRPTSERVREGLASALSARGMFEDARVLDLYAGTGALAFEALSRHAKHALLIDKSRPVARAIERSAGELDLSSQVTVLQADLERRNATHWLDAIREPVDLVFADPPYDQIAELEVILSTLAREAKLAPGAAVVIEHARRAPPTLPLGFSELSSYRYGDTGVLLAEFTPDDAQTNDVHTDVQPDEES